MGQGLRYHDLDRGPHPDLLPKYLLSALNLFTTRCYKGHLYHQPQPLCTPNPLLSTGFTYLPDITEVSLIPQGCEKLEMGPIVVSLD